MDAEVPMFMNRFKTKFIRVLLIVFGLTWGLVSVGAGTSLYAQASSEKLHVEQESAKPDPERPIAFVRRFKPKVSIFNRSLDKFMQAEKAEKLYDGDTLATGENGYAAVQFMDNSLAKVTPSSLLLINGEVDNDTRSTSTRILLNAGEIMMNVVDQNRGDFEVATSSSVATVKGTRFGSTAGAKGQSYHYVIEGSIEVNATQSGQSATIDAGEYARVGAEGEEIETGELSSEELEERKRAFKQFDEKVQPKTIEFQFRDENGNMQQIELKYYENQEEN